MIYTNTYRDSHAPTCGGSPQEVFAISSVEGAATVVLTPPTKGSIHVLMCIAGYDDGQSGTIAMSSDSGVAARSSAYVMPTAAAMAQAQAYAGQSRLAMPEPPFTPNKAVTVTLPPRGERIGFVALEYVIV